jgi:hypothetical protein
MRALRFLLLAVLLIFVSAWYTVNCLFPMPESEIELPTEYERLKKGLEIADIQINDIENYLMKNEGSSVPQASINLMRQSLSKWKANRDKLAVRFHSIKER